MTYTDEQIVKGLETNDRKVFEYLYQKMLPWVYTYITGNSGSREDAEDLFTRLLLTIKENILDGKYEQRNFEGYFKEVCRRLWWKELRKKGLLNTKRDEETINTEQEMHYHEPQAQKGRVVAFDSYQHDRAEEDDEADQPNYRMVQLMLQTMKDKLGDDCRELLSKQYFLNQPLQEVADAMGWTYQYCRVKVVRCKDSLKKLVMADPAFNNV